MKTNLSIFSALNSAKLKEKSANAVASFHKVIDDLKTLNGLSQLERDKLVLQQNEIKLEIKELESISATNTKIIDNIESFFK